MVIPSKDTKAQTVQELDLESELLIKHQDQV